MKKTEKGLSGCVLVCFVQSSLCIKWYVHCTIVHACEQAKPSQANSICFISFSCIFEQTFYAYMHKWCKMWLSRGCMSASDKWDENEITKFHLFHRAKFRWKPACTDCQVPWAGSSWPTVQTIDHSLFFVHEFDQLIWKVIVGNVIKNTTYPREPKFAANWRVWYAMRTIALEMLILFADRFVKCKIFALISGIGYRLTIRIPCSSTLFPWFYPFRETLCENGKNHLQLCAHSQKCSFPSRRTETKIQQKCSIFWLHCMSKGM